ncbi:hypothetical protein D5R95_03435 [Methanosalsum natronophilum]|uniref:Uncharacterized protein n=1 Tax=Methanosalsum natronophilum TaxID=768733 RepID=A0A424Z0N4_9EURY|nr:MAG: hypothetical protein D5R95_03435 [Methanosalsum natronophilum]
MRRKVLISLLLVSVILSMPIAYAISDHNSAEYMHVYHMTIKFQEENAEVSLYYNLDFFSSIYTLFLGSRNLEQTFENFLYEFDSIEIKEIGRNYAIINVYDISREADQYYLHDSKKLAAPVDVLTIVYPNGAQRAHNDVDATPNIFYSKA